MKSLSASAALVTLLLSAASANAANLSHRYSFNDGTANDSVGSANGTLKNTATVSGGLLNLNNPNFTGPGTAGGYLALPASIIPATGSVTIEQWFTFTGSGFFTEAWTFSNNNNDTNPPTDVNGQYLMHTISAPQNGAIANSGSHIAQATSGYTTETDAFSTTAGLGAGGGGYLDDGGTYMAATVINGAAGTLSYYIFRVSDGLGGLQQSVTAIPLSSYSFTNAYLGRSAFPVDNSTSGTVDEFRIYTDALTTAQILADFQAGPNAVPEPASLALLTLGAAALLSRRKSTKIP